MEEYHMTIKDRILLDNRNILNQNENNKIFKPLKKQSEPNKKDTEQLDDTIFPTNSCFDEQSFFIKENSKNLNDNKTNLSIASHNMVSNLYNSNNPQNLKYDDLLHLQSFRQSDSQQKNNNKIIKDFIKRNNYKKENNCNHDSEEDEDEDEDSIKEGNINMIKNNNDYLLIIQNFLEREKKFENKLISDKERRILLQDIDLLNNYQDKPNICEKSSKLAFKKNKNFKVYDRLYANAFSVDKKSKYYEYNNNNKNNKFNNNIKTNLSKNQNIKNKNTFTNNRRYELLKDDNSNNNNEEKMLKNDNNNFNRNNSKNNIKKSTNDQMKIYKSNTLKIFNKVDFEYRNLVKKENKDKLFNEYNKQSATEKMNIVLIKKINNEIDNLLSINNINKKDTKNNGINFYFFSDLLFKLGYVCVLHTKNSNNKNKEMNKNCQELSIQPFLNKSLVTKNFIDNELIIINKAFNSIINNFKISQESNNKENNDIESMLLQNNDKTIQIEDFKLFIFILSNIFIGYKNELQRIEPKNNNNINEKNENENSINNNNSKSTNSNKANKSTTINNSNISGEDKIKPFTKVNNLIKKIVPNIKINTLSFKDIFDFKNNFNYMINTKNNHIIFLYNEKKNLKKDRLEQCIISPCTFAPKTNNNKNLILNCIKPNMNFEERNKVLSKKKNKHQMDIKKELDQEYIEQHPFNPKLNGDKSIEYLKRIKKKCQKEKIEKEKNNINVIKPQEENNKNIEIKDILNFSLNPNAKKPLRQKMFSQSPLANDKMVNEKIKAMRACNFSKKLKIFENNNREILRNDVKNNIILINYIINNEIEGRMNLSIEKKSNKDNTFDKFKKRKKNSCDGYKGNLCELLNPKNKNNYPLFSLEVKIKNESNIIEVFPNDDYEKLCFNFCMEHKLGEDSYNQILESIKNKIKEINNYSI